MRVALFFDGKNHMKDLRRAAQDKWIDHSQLAQWIVNRVGGDRFVGAHYFTGVPAPGDEGSERHALTDLLEELERRPGFFVRRFNRRVNSRECPHCGVATAYTEEKMVDTSLVTDLVMLAVRDAYDCAVVFSGDLDVSPALTAVRAMGKQVWIATFGEQALSRHLLREAWGHVDLLPHLDAFSHAGVVPRVQALPPPGRAPMDVDAMPPMAMPMGVPMDGEVLRELRRAEAHFAAGGGFVGSHYFIHRWKGHNIPDGPEERRLAVQRLVDGGHIQPYTVDGKSALRTSGPVSGPVPLDDALETVSLSGIDDEEATVELRMSDTMVRRLRSRSGDDG